MKGAIRWMAPELIVQGRGLSVKSSLHQTSRDIYAFGCTVVEVNNLPVSGLLFSTTWMYKYWNVAGIDSDTTAPVPWSEERRSCIVQFIKSRTAYATQERLVFRRNLEAHDSLLGRSCCSSSSGSRSLRGSATIFIIEIEPKLPLLSGVVVDTYLWQSERKTEQWHEGSISSKKYLRLPSYHFPDPGGFFLFREVEICLKPWKSILHCRCNTRVASYLTLAMLSGFNPAAVSGSSLIIPERRHDENTHLIVVCRQLTSVKNSLSCSERNVI